MYINLEMSLQPPFYSRNKTEMYDKTLKKPLEFRTKENISEAAIDILSQVIIRQIIVSWQYWYACVWERLNCMTWKWWTCRQLKCSNFDHWLIKKKMKRWRNINLCLVNFAELLEKNTNWFRWNFAERLDNRHVPLRKCLNVGGI